MVRYRTVFHLADLHVPVEGSRKDEYRSVFWRFLDDVRRHGSVARGEAISVIAGDVFHSKCKAGTDCTVALFEMLNELLSLMPVVVICGNHDFKQEDPDVQDSIRMLVAPYGRGERHGGFDIHYLEDTGTYVFGNIGIGVVSVKDTLRKFNTAGQVDELPLYPDASKISDVDIRIALFHGTVTESRKEGYEAYPLEWFAGYDVAMLGDNHIQQTGKAYGIDLVWGYPGSMIQQTFGESVYGHGYIEWDVETKHAVCRHISNDFGRITMSYVCGDWLVQLKKGCKGVPLDTACVDPRFPKRPHIRIVGGSKKKAQMALNQSGLECSGWQVVGGATHAGGVESSRAEGIRTMSDLNNPRTWIDYLRKHGHCTTSHVLENPEKLVIPALEADDAMVIQKHIDEYRKTLVEPDVEEHRITLGVMRWSYLMCYGADNEFDFKDKNIDDRVVLLNGGNASGKSSFLDVLCIAMYGETTPSRRDISGTSQGNIIHDKKPADKACRVSLEFFVDGRGYEITRTFTHRFQCSRTASAVVLSRECDGSERTVAEGVTMVKNWISKRFGSSSNMLVSSILQQLDNTGFFMKKPSERKEMIEQVLNMKSVNAMAGMLRKSVSIYKRTADHIEARIAERMKIVGNDKRIELEEIDSLCGEKKELERLEEQERSRATAMLEQVTNVVEAKVLTESMREMTIADIDVETQSETEKFMDYRDVTDCIDEEIALENKVERMKERVGVGNGESCACRPLDTIQQEIDEHEGRRPKTPVQSREITADVERRYKAWVANFQGIFRATERAALKTATLDEIRRLEGLKSELESVSYLKAYGDGTSAYTDRVNIQREDVEALVDEAGFVYEKHVECRSWCTGETKPKMSLRDIDNVLKEKHNRAAELGIDMGPCEIAMEMGILRARINECNNAMVDHIGKPQMDRPVNAIGEPVGCRSRIDDIRADISHVVSSGYKRDARRIEDWKRRLSVWNKVVKGAATLKTQKELDTDMKRVKEQLRIIVLRDDIIKELEALETLELNPQCSTCSKQPKFMRMEHLRRELTEYSRNITTRDWDRDALKKRHDKLRADIELRSEYDNQREKMSREIEAWEETMKAKERVEQLTNDLALAWWQLWDTQEKQRMEKNALCTRYGVLSESAANNTAIEMLMKEKKGAELWTEAKHVEDTLRAKARMWFGYMRMAKEALESCVKTMRLIDRYEVECDEWFSKIEEARDATLAWNISDEWDNKKAELSEELAKGRRRELIRIIEKLEIRLQRIRIARQIRDRLVALDNVVFFRKYLDSKEKGEEATRKLAEVIHKIEVLRERHDKQCSEDKETRALKDQCCAVVEQHDDVKELYRVFVGDKDTCGYKSWLYTTKVVPLLETEVNRFVAPLESFQLSVGVNKGDDMVFRIVNNDCRPLLDHASGYQKFIIGLGMRVALARIGASGQNLKHLFIDEGFTACDQVNITKTKDIIDNLKSYGKYQSVMLISHMEAIRDMVDKRADIRIDNNGFSLLRFPLQLQSIP